METVSAALGCRDVRVTTARKIVTSRSRDSREICRATALPSARGVFQVERVVDAMGSNVRIDSIDNRAATMK
jgi:hypothetical protein